jgi:hypothetical protein
MEERPDVLICLKKLHKSIMNRCYCKSNGNYKYYGGRGIAVCKKWHSFPAFYKDMKESWFKGAELDRIHSSRGYSKSNCRWVTHKENMRNRRCSLYCEVEPGVFMSLGDVVDTFGINVNKAKRKYKTIRKEILFNEGKRYFEITYR